VAHKGWDSIKKKQKEGIKWGKISSCYLWINVLAKFENHEVGSDFVTNQFRFNNKLGAPLQKKKSYKKVSFISK